MKKAILTTKVGMTQIFDENGVLIPVTVLQAGPCVVTQVKTVENDGYSAVQVGYGEAKNKIVAKDVAGKKVVNAHGVNKAQRLENVRTRASKMPELRRVQKTAQSLRSMRLLQRQTGRCERRSLSFAN